MRHYDLRSGPNVADLQVNLKHKKERSAQSHAIAKRLREPLQKVAAEHGAAIKVVEVPPGPPVLSTLVAEIYGPTEVERRETADQVYRVFSTTDDVVDLDWTLEAPQTKLLLQVDREKAGLAQVQPAQVTRALRLALEGETTGLLHIDSEEEAVPVKLRLPRAQRSSSSDLTNLRVRSASAL